MYPLLTLQCCPPDGGVCVWAARVLHETRQKPQRVSLHARRVGVTSVYGVSVSVGVRPRLLRDPEDLEHLTDPGGTNHLCPSE